MKKILLIIITLLLISIGYAQNKKSNYENYWQDREDSLYGQKTTDYIEYDDVYYQPNKDKNIKQVKKDTLEKKLVINNYYYDENDFFYTNRLRHFYYPRFYFDWNDWYTPYYYGGWYNNFYFGWNYRPHYWYTSRYNHNYYGYNHNYYGYNHNYYHRNNTQSRNNLQYSRRERPSTQINRGNNGGTQNRIYEKNKRTYVPSYSTPRTGTRPIYNNSKDSYNRPSTNTETRKYSQPNNNRPSSTPRTYSTPTNRNSNGYSRPLNNGNSGSNQRNSSNGSTRTR